MKTDSLIEAIGATAEIMGTQLQPTSLMVMADDLSGYPLEKVLIALTRCRREITGKLTLAAVIDRLNSNDGRPGADEAWGMIPRNESVSAVLSQDMLTAMGAAQPLLDEGDQVAARMAFKESYNRLITEARNNSIPVQWFPSLGDDKNGREAVVKEAVRLGRVSEVHAQKLLPNISNWTELMRLA
jgi:hypothetical protein